MDPHQFGRIDRDSIFYLIPEQTILLEKSAGPVKICGKTVNR